MNPKCPIHNVEMASSQWGGFYCKGQKMPDGSWCKEKARAGTTASTQAFSQGLDKSAHQMDEKKKGDAMGRNNIAHAMIRAGKTPTLEALNEAERWFRWSRGEMGHITGKVEAESQNEAEVNYDDIPY